MIFESRLTYIPGSEPPAYTAGPEWTNTEHQDLRDWLEVAIENCPGIELCPGSELPAVYEASGADIYRWPDSDPEFGWQYTAIREEPEIEPLHPGFTDDRAFRPPEGAVRVFWSIEDQMYVAAAEVAISGLGATPEEALAQLRIAQAAAAEIAKEGHP